MSARTGSAGEYGCDGWVEWTTSDDSNSYLPALHCGHYEIIIGRGERWGAGAETHGIAIPSSYQEGRIVDTAGILAVHDDEHSWTPLRFPWAPGPLVDACVLLAECLGHPAPENVRKAATELYFALLQIEARKAVAS